MNKRAAEADLRLKRLYDAIESGVAGLDAPELKERIVGLKKSVRDHAQADAERMTAALESTGQQTITPAMCGSSLRPPATDYGSPAAATAAIIFVRLPSALRSRMARSGSWDQKTIY